MTEKTDPAFAGMTSPDQVIEDQGSLIYDTGFSMTQSGLQRFGIMMKKSNMNKHYVSPIDIKIREFDAIHQPSDAQQAEMKKYAAIYKKRDEAIPAEKPKKSIWD